MRTLIRAGLGMAVGPGLLAATGTTIATAASGLDAGDRVDGRLHRVDARLGHRGDRAERRSGHRH